MTTAVKSEYTATVEQVREAGGINKVLASAFEVKVEKRAEEIMALGALNERSGLPTYIERVSDLPLAIAAHLASLGAEKTTTVVVRLMRPFHGGQEGGGNGNLLAVIAARSAKAGGGVVVAEVGCEHQFTGRNLGRCYNEYRCTKCDYFYRVDSSD